MPLTALTRRDYERLSPGMKEKASMILEELKGDLRKHHFSLRFLGHHGQWKDLTPWKFFTFSEDYYKRLITGAKWVRPQPREDLLEQISELYDLVRQSPKLEETTLERYSRDIPYR